MTSQTNNQGDLNNACGTGCTNYAYGSVSRYANFTMTGTGEVTLTLPYTTTLTLENTEYPDSYIPTSGASFSGSYSTSVAGNVINSGSFAPSSFSFAPYSYNPSDVGTHSGYLTGYFIVGGKNPITTGYINFSASTSASSLITAAPAITAAVPEPETYAMMMAGLGLVGVVARRRKQLGTAANAV